MKQIYDRGAVTQDTFHHLWCNSKSDVNTALQGPRFVLVSDPFTKDSAPPAVPDSERPSRCKNQASQPGNLSAKA